MRGAPAAPGVAVRRVETLAEYQECVAIQHEIWGPAFSECVPATILQLAQKLGGVVAAAFAPDGRMLGFVFGLAGVRDGRLVHWSDLLAVRPEARGAHLGERLKYYQRDLARAGGARVMYWTFDPLVARNAHLNLARLGARAVEYVPDMYGSNTGSPLHGGLPTDRFVAEWTLDPADGVPADGVPADGVPAAAPPGGRASNDGAPAPPLVNPLGAEGAPAPAPVLVDAPRVRVAVPRDVGALSPELRGAWRAATRAALLAYLGRGYTVRGFRGGADGELPWYELARGA